MGKIVDVRKTRGFPTKGHREWFLVFDEQMRGMAMRVIASLRARSRAAASKTAGKLGRSGETMFRHTLIALTLFAYFSSVL